MNSGKRPDAFQSNLPLSTMMPPIEVPWPPMNLVAELTTMSAPHSMGRHSAGEGVVLSMISGSPLSWAIVGQLLDVQHVELGIADASRRRRPGSCR